MSAKKPDSIFFDSNVYINLLRFPEYEAKIEKFLQGAHQYTVNKIVLMELWAGVKTKAEENILKQHQKYIPLIGFSDDNFVIAGQIMRKMVNEHSFQPRTRRQLTWDILIALSGKENNALLVTENNSDFKKIQKYLEFEFITVT